MTDQLDNIDLTYLKTISDGDEAIVKELIEIFIEQVPEFTIGLQDNFKLKNWNSIAALAHKAKSSVISMGMTELGEVDLKNLELLAKNKRIREIEESDDNDEGALNELQQLIQNLEGYPKDKQDWVAENDQNETIKKIIDKFVANCDNALKELNSVLEN